MEIRKIVFMGPVGAGKTTAVRTATDDHSVMTDMPTGDVAAIRKGFTTVAMDYGVVDLDENTRIHVHGCPGQKRFDFMWPIVTRGAYGLVLLIDNNRNYPQRDLKQYLSAIYKQLPNTRLIVGITRTDVSDSPPLSEYGKWLQELHINAEVMKVDPREKADVLLLLGRLLTTETGHACISSDEGKATKLLNKSGIENYLPEADMVNFDKSTVVAVNKIRGVTGATLTTSMGDLLDSTIDDEAINEFIAFLSGVTPGFEKMVGLGSAERVMLKSPKDDSLTAIVGTDHVLGISTERSLSLSLLGQQVEDLVQWIDQ
ncbi:MAG: hypothetical protein GY697_19975 [Desulfobacterales bacterium]|nr:hypothetical protein [Desulfobacterales bacterium]